VVVRPRAREGLGLLEGALLHAPIALFVLPMPFLLIFGLSLDGAPRIVLLALAWWSGSGAAMMIVDARARRARYGRIVELAGATGRAPSLPGLTDTICGKFMSRALRYRVSAGYHRSIRKGVEI
jgi:hypothetical protein